MLSLSLSAVMTGRGCFSVLFGGFVGRDRKQEMSESVVITLLGHSWLSWWWVACGVIDHVTHVQVKPTKVMGAGQLLGTEQKLGTKSKNCGNPKDWHGHRT